MRRQTALERNMQKSLTAKLKPQITSEVATITPEIAAAWLDENRNNRVVSRVAVDKYARDMLSGQWRLTGDAIRFSSSRRLLDGQHRLLACVKAQCNFQSLVIYGVADEAQVVMDTGKNRRASDFLTISGMNHAQAATGVARLGLDEKFGVHLGHRGWSTVEVIEFIQRHPLIYPSCRVVWAPKMPRRISKTQLAFIHFVGSSLLDRKQAADAFVAVFATGIPSYDGCPAHKLRERLLKDGDGATALKRREMYNATKYAWNIFAEGKPLRTLNKWSIDVEINGLDKTLL